MNSLPESTSIRKTAPRDSHPPFDSSSQVVVVENSGRGIEGI